MRRENNVMIINKQALTQAARELEKQEAFHSLLLLHCLDQLEDIHRKLCAVITEANSQQAQNAALTLWMNDAEWKQFLTDQQKKFALSNLSNR